MGSLGIRNVPPHPPAVTAISKDNVSQELSAFISQRSCLRVNPIERKAEPIDKD